MPPAALRPAVSRLARLTLDDIITGDDGQVFIRLGDPPTPVPEPFAAMLTELAANRVNMNTATRNPAAALPVPSVPSGLSHPGETGTVP